MARQFPDSGGGKDLASVVYDFMRSNTDIIKKESLKNAKDPKKNERIALEDLAGAIAYGVEVALEQKFKMTSTQIKCTFTSPAMAVGTAIGAAIATNAYLNAPDGIILLTGQDKNFQS